MIHVLFVCLGNICRSPMAEAIFRDLVEKEGLTEKINVDSAGTGDWHVGSPPHQGTLEILNEYQINADKLLARKFTKKDLDKFDYIIGMDESNIGNMNKISGHTPHSNMIRLLDLTDQPKDVPDPYYTGDFQETYRLVSLGCQHLLEKIKAEMKLTK
ncbi:low molecular weight protein-tyrosine-phosphatase [Lederbergia galactosidilytica]|uniref:protein-tyrosine-phosphatase n=1 Tax=Lederbergia galactosidilytica TaxID=217031 RepID=A0A178A0Z8_9BACI|nr:low molecular weight protein-tyrosine-phosphatase [Lederbergia galactosidilytica]KRG10947.1 protein tyrosine phosphatase [Virgibacillus soli]MBP1913799.1 protein-tyrosine phosphatase [Lederbergia galactosidilytica]OAK73855.1 protein tyrosine phosphatase [Lederbergia galactosidilytica]